MTVCKFFQQGSCRYGQNCRFEHVYGSKYTYHSNAAPQQQPSPAPSSVTDEQLVNQVHSDVQSALRGGQWLLSSYAPFKEKPSFPGINDLSPEEARLFIYEAKSNNTLDQAVAYMNNLFKDARTKYEQLLVKNVNITKVFRNLYKGENVSSPFGIQEPAPSNNAASSIFRSAIQTSPYGQNSQSGQSVFGQPQSVFAQNTPSVFQSATSDPAKSIFSQASQNTFGQASQTPFGNQNSVFGAQSPNGNSSPQGIFGQSDSAQSLFAQASQSAFTQSSQSPSALFGNAAQAQANNLSPFGQSQSNMFQRSESQSFGANPNVFQQNIQSADPNNNVYSKIEELSPEDIEAYKSHEFKLGFVPELPPPQALCI